MLNDNIIIVFDEPVSGPTPAANLDGCLRVLRRCSTCPLIVATKPLIAPIGDLENIGYLENGSPNLSTELREFAKRIPPNTDLAFVNQNLITDEQAILSTLDLLNIDHPHELSYIPVQQGDQWASLEPINGNRTHYPLAFVTTKAGVLASIRFEADTIKTLLTKLFLSALEQQGDIYQIPSSICPNSDSLFGDLCAIDPTKLSLQSAGTIDPETARVSAHPGSPVHTGEFGWLGEITQKLPRFLDLVLNKDCSYSKYSLSGDLLDANTHWGLGNLVFAAKILYTKGLPRFGSFNLLYLRFYFVACARLLLRSNPGIV